MVTLEIKQLSEKLKNVFQAKERIRESGTRNVNFTVMWLQFPNRKMLVSTDKECDQLSRGSHW